MHAAGLVSSERILIIPDRELAEGQTPRSIQAIVRRRSRTRRPVHVVAHRPAYRTAAGRTTVAWLARSAPLDRSPERIESCAQRPPCMHAQSLAPADHTTHA